MLSYRVPPEIEAVALLGWRLYPASQRSKAGCFTGATDAATADLEQIALWNREYRQPNWRVVMEGSGVWAMDIDAPNGDHAADGISAMKSLTDLYGKLPDAPVSRSGGGGYAVFFRDDGHPISGKTGTPSPGLDPRRGRLSVTIPNSIHVRTRDRYKWIVAPWECDPPPAPDWLLKMVRPPPDPAVPRTEIISTCDRALRWLHRSVENIINAPMGTGNDTLNKNAFLVSRHVASGTLTEGEAIGMLYAAAISRGIPAKEAKDTIRSAFRRGVNQPYARGTYGRG